MHIRKDFGNGDRVGDVRFAALAKLAFVSGLGEFKRSFDLRDILGL